MMIYIVVHQQGIKPSATKRAIIPTTFKLFYSYIKKSNTKLGLPSMTRKRNSLEKSSDQLVMMAYPPLRKPINK